MLYLKRKIDAFLAEWKANPDRKPLIVKGPRQVGKTESIKRFGDMNYQSVITINFVEEPKYKMITADGYKADDIMKQVRNMQKLSESTNNQLIWIASISLLVGGIGVMNIMLVSVTERTKEIGLKKAIGARKKTILGQFLTEASVLTSIGGIIGVVTGIGLSKVVGKVTGSPTAISIPSIVVAVLFSTVIGVVFGLLPSVKAANLNPIDALRSE